MRAHVPLIAVVPGLVFAAGAMAATLTGSPDPAPVCDGSKATQIMINWNAADGKTSEIEIHVGSPTGALFTAGGAVGSAPRRRATISDTDEANEQPPFA